MKICLLVIFIGLCINEGRAQARYKAGDTLYVWVKNKLQVRDSPTGQVVGSLEYGERVIMLQDDTGGNSPMQALPITRANGKANPKVTVSGHYVEVSFKKMKGYVFDAYLLKFPPLRKLSNNQNEPLHTYFSRTFGLLKTLNAEQGEENYSRFRYVYNNGAFYESYSSSCCGNSTLIIPDLSLSEAFVFANYLYSIENYFKDVVDSGPVVEVIENKDYGNGDYLSFTFELEYICIRKIYNNVILTYEGGD